jgi:hypothetical protein
MNRLFLVWLVTWLILLPALFVLLLLCFIANGLACMKQTLWPDQLA